MNVELLHVRDSDGGCYIEVWVDGHKVPFTEENVDPGRGHEVGDWYESIEYTARAEGYSPEFRAAALAAQVESLDSKYIDGSTGDYVDDLVQDFLANDEDARVWLEWNGVDPEDRETVDCDVISERFVVWLEAREVTSHLVHVRPLQDTGELYSDHWFVALDYVGLAVDWTARQFHNVPKPSVGADTIDCPLVFEWPGIYPLPYVSFTEVVE